MLTPFSCRQSGPVFIHTFAVFTFSATVVQSFSIVSTNTANTLGQAVLGGSSQLTLNSATFQGNAASAGTYTNGPLGILDGVILASGLVLSALPNPGVTPNPGTEFSLIPETTTTGALLCNQIAGSGPIYDSAALTLNIASTSAIGGLTASFIFASAEYPWFVGSKFNDQVVIFVDGVPITFDGSGDPIAVNGQFFGPNSVVVPPLSGTSYGGSTPLLQGSVPLTAGNHIVQIAVCDNQDAQLDSAVLINIAECIGPCTGAIVVENPGTSVSSSVLSISATNTVSGSLTIPTNSQTLITTAIQTFTSPSTDLGSGGVVVNVVVGIEVVVVVNVHITFDISLQSSITITEIVSTITNPVYAIATPNHQCYVCAMASQGISCPSGQYITVTTTACPSCPIQCPVTVLPVVQTCRTCQAITLTNTAALQVTTAAAVWNGGPNAPGNNGAIVPPPAAPTPVTNVLYHGSAQRNIGSLNFSVFALLALAFLA